MNESKALRVLADKLDELELLKAFPVEISDPGEVTVSWVEGRDHDGYPALSAAISALVGQHWNALRSQVLKSKEGEVQVARNAVTGLGGVPTLDAEPVGQAGPDMGARRFG